MNNTLLTMVAYLIRNPWTSSAGTGLLMTNLGAVLTMAGSGQPFSVIVADPHFQNLLTGFGLLAAKDVNVTGGRRGNA